MSEYPPHYYDEIYPYGDNRYPRKHRSQNDYTKPTYDPDYDQYYSSVYSTRGDTNRPNRPKDRLDREYPRSTPYPEDQQYYSPLHYTRGYNNNKEDTRGYNNNTNKHNGYNRNHGENNWQLKPSWFVQHKIVVIVFSVCFVVVGATAVGTYFALASKGKSFFF